MKNKLEVAAITVVLQTFRPEHAWYVFIFIDRVNIKAIKVKRKHNSN